MKKTINILLLILAAFQLNAQQFVDTYIHIRPAYGGNTGELMVMDCEDPNATVTKTVTFEGSPIPSMQATGISSGVKTLHYTATDGVSLYEFQAEIDFNPVNPSINYTTSPNVEPMSVIETFSSATAACDGEINLMISGGNLPYGISWYTNGTPIPGTVNQTSINNLCADNYSYEFNDNSTLCAGGNNFLFNVQLPLLECFVDVTDVSCFGACDATANLILTGQGRGIMSSTVVNDYGDSDPMGLSNQCPGMIAGTITDVTGAMAQCDASIIEPDLINFDINTTDITSPGAEDGTAEITLSQGPGTYTYDWGGPNGYSSSGTSQVSNLDHGNYDVNITYNTGQCDTAASFTIYDVLQLQITNITEHTSNPPNGAVEFTISGGAMPYDTILDDGVTQTNGPFTGLSFGEYTLIVTDDKGNSVDSTFMINTYVSTTKETKNNLKIYPNPANNILNVEGEDLIDAVVYDANGRKMLEHNFDTITIDISTLAQGIYTLQIEAKNTTYSKKIIVR